jgi:hypothetical protein
MIDSGSAPPEAAIAAVMVSVVVGPIHDMARSVGVWTSGAVGSGQAVQQLLQHRYRLQHRP